MILHPETNKYSILLLSSISFPYELFHTNTMGIFSNTRFGSVFHKRSPQVTNPPSGAQNFVLCLAWVLAGVLTVLVPLIYRTKKMNDYKEMYNMWNWEEAQKAYEEQRNQYYENQYANQWNQGNYNWEQMTGNYDINQCRWWQLNCFPYYINENGRAST